MTARPVRAPRPQLPCRGQDAASGLAVSGAHPQAPRPPRLGRALRWAAGVGRGAERRGRRLRGETLCPAAARTVGAAGAGGRERARGVRAGRGVGRTCCHLFIFGWSGRLHPGEEEGRRAGGELCEDRFSRGPPGPGRGISLFSDGSLVP